MERFRHRERGSCITAQRLPSRRTHSRITALTFRIIGTDACLTPLAVCGVGISVRITQTRFSVTQTAVCIMQLGISMSQTEIPMTHTESCMTQQPIAAMQTRR